MTPLPRLERDPVATAGQPSELLRPRDPPVVGTFGLSVIALSGAFVLAGLAWPQAAEVLLRLFLVTLASAFVVWRAYDTMLAARVTQDSGSPFHGPAEPDPPSIEPEGLRVLTKELRPADELRLAKRSPIPRLVCWILIDDATRRLAARHGLNLHEPEHQSAIRSLVSETTWLLIRRSNAEPGTRDRSRPESLRVTLSALGTILGDVERL